MKNQLYAIAVNNYFKKYPDAFSSYEQKQILRMVTDYGSSLFGLECVREIYDELGLIPDDKNIYVGFMNIIDKEFGIEGKNIVEVGGGHIPRLAKRLSEKQVKGKVEVYDPLISRYERSTPKLSLVRTKFDEKMIKRGDTDLLVGLQPCAAAERILEAAIQNDIDFIIALCEGGPHGEWFDFYESDDEWLYSIITRAKRGVEEKSMGKLIVENSLEKYNDTYPVIYNKRIK